jgi:hypothetical protein
MNIYAFIYLNLFKNVMNNISQENTNKREIVKTWLAGQHSCTLIIPKEFAKQYGLDEPSHVIVEGMSEGILIKKLKI